MWRGPQQFTACGRVVTLTDVSSANRGPFTIVYKAHAYCTDFHPHDLDGYAGYQDRERDAQPESMKVLADIIIRVIAENAATLNPTPPP